MKLFSNARAFAKRLLPPATGEGRDGGDVSCEVTPIPTFPRKRRKGLRYLALGFTLFAMVIIALRLVPTPALSMQSQYSSAVYAADGTLLRLTTAPDQQYRLWTPYVLIAPKVAEAVLQYEDRWYWWHPGVNPAALIRSAKATFSGERRQGGSTISMQLARKIYDIDSRSIVGKLQQIAAAFWLEARYSKRDILEAYLNFAPYGGNIEGVGAASLVYFQKRAADLTLPEALTLAGGDVGSNSFDRGRRSKAGR